jgi:hypothetical protein
MTDYAATPVQPIVQGLITLVDPDVPADGINFFGKGILLTGPLAPVRTAAGNYTLTLDPGLPGDVAIDPPFGRFLITIRGTVGVPTIIENKSIAYLTSPTLSATAVGANQIQILLADSAGALSEFDGEGVEIILWRADAGVELVNAQLIGPLFQNN